MRRIAVGTMAASLSALALIAGCSNDDPVTAPPPPGPTVADSPANAVRALAAACEARDTVTYRGLFTSDYVFVITASDTAGTGMPATDLNWGDEMRFARHCFRVGTSQLFPAQSILFVLDPSLVDVPDDRPGKNATWHRQVESTTHVTVDAIDTVFDVFQAMRFYTTRGDSAAVTPEIRGSGGLPDAERWYIDRIEPAGPVVVAARQESARRPRVTPSAFAAGAPSPASHAPSGGTTMGRLKLSYLVP